MKVSKSGAYVMVQKFGIEGLLEVESTDSIAINSQATEITIKGVSVKTFDHLSIKI